MFVRDADGIYFRLWLGPRMWLLIGRWRKRR
jgi:hypothetical protein